MTTPVTNQELREKAEARGIEYLVEQIEYPAFADPKTKALIGRLSAIRDEYDRRLLELQEHLGIWKE